MKRHGLTKKASVTEAKKGDDRLARLVREGIVRPAGSPATKVLFTTAPPRVKRKGVSGVRAFLDDRREGR